MKLTSPIIVYLPDTRGVEVSPYGLGNLKLGPDVFTFSQPAGHPHNGGTCPGASRECEEICYAKRIKGVVLEVYQQNMDRDSVPEIPQECSLLRIHVSGDFDSAEYVDMWRARLEARPDVTCWAYTRSWRVPEILAALIKLRELPNVQIFASMDSSIEELPPVDWRVAWIDGDPRAGALVDIPAHHQAANQLNAVRNARTYNGTPSYLCPEETKHVKNCQECGYCFDGRRNDVTFLKH